MTDQELVDALWEKVQAEPEFLYNHLEEVESITGLIDLGDLDNAIPKIRKLLDANETM